eukprot:7340383-Prymnesium_polylepis.1
MRAWATHPTLRPQGQPKRALTCCGCVFCWGSQQAHEWGEPVYKRQHVATTENAAAHSQVPGEAFRLVEKATLSARCQVFEA